MTATRPVTKSRPILMSSPMVCAILDGRKAQTRRPVVVKTSVTSIPRGHLTDLSRAWADRGFPTDEDGGIMPMGRWGGGADPAPESAYREHYLHVPFVHPEDGWSEEPSYDRVGRVFCPYGRPGDRLWVKETWSLVKPWCDPDSGHVEDFEEWSGPIPGSRPDGWSIMYRADWDSSYDHPDDRMFLWRPSIFMPRWASRITLEIIGTRVERLHEITEADAKAEGVDSVAAFRRLWDEINPANGYGWDSDCWAWVMAFRRVEPAEAVGC